MDDVMLTLESPDEVFPTRSGRTVFQRIFENDSGKVYLIRAIVEMQWSPPEVVTVYKSSLQRRYWRK